MGSRRPVFLGHRVPTRLLWPVEPKNNFALMVVEAVYTLCPTDMPIEGRAVKDVPRRTQTRSVYRDRSVRNDCR